MVFLGFSTHKSQLLLVTHLMDTAEPVSITLRYKSSSEDPLTPTEALCPPLAVLFNTFADAAEKDGKSGLVFSAKGDYEEI